MGEETKETEKKAPEVTIESLQAQLVETNTALEQIKSAQAGSDKAYKKASEEAAALRSENEKLAKEKMTAAEQSKYDLEQEKASIAQSKLELAEATLRLKKVKAVEKAGLPASFEGRITGTTDDEIAADITALTEQVESLVGSRVKDALGKSPKPGGGDTPKAKGSLSELSEAQMIALEEKGELDAYVTQ